MRERLAALVVTCVLIVGSFGLVRPAQPWVQGLPEDVFWLRKLQWRAEFDVALAGDSRMYQGVAPAELAAALPGLRIANYGFSGCGFSPEYLDAVEGILDPHGARRIIVLGVTPHALTPNAVGNNGFISLTNTDPFSAWAVRTFPAAAAYLKPFQTSELRALSGAAPAARLHNTFHADGWVASHKDPEVPNEALVEYRRRFEGGNRVSENIEDALAARVARWRARGMAVVAFRPPVSPEMLTLERSMSGFDQDRFVKKFESAGGVWLDVDRAGYHSYDGSHLEDRAARRFSRDLGAKIAAALQGLGM